ncbi:pyridine nucleotide-disulfide oxidoreductase [Mangrovimonas yunxiaonensis]|uniref:Pyridine nucleotide-disulfide oxidoreductase n=1 Tax=Mangrovimonas yunxiaonensis TaxID=1197477 RepID=A0A084TK72_9FLAO|nr:NAD(P)/FAD-dependent oxidoreductase [Mangrovimonas yunxiaonensis]KFB01108.1 pyridine nucleotide-disulfide oxidoreductase [Mangrovimonas yunxiaonensis]GGH38631.1 dehydrogenase/oxidoreductase [Mangrovimonas yunxiaonensis]
MSDINVDVLIIGAGPSGCVAASYLFKQGLKVKVLEKSKFPRFVIGESLLPRCMDHFEEVGLLACLEAQNFELKPGARFLRDDIVCNFDFSKKHTAGWDWTWQVPRADFDNTLAQELIKWGVDIRFQHEVLDVAFDADGNSVTTVKDQAGETYKVNAKFVVDSSGYGRVLPRLLNLDKPSSLPEHSSIFTHVKEPNRPEGEEGTLITFDVLDRDTWFWVIPFSNGVTSLGFVSKNEYIDSFEGSTTARMKQMIETSSYYKDRFRGLDFEFDPICIRNYSKAVSKLYGKGFVLTGNSAEFLDPVFSSGVTFATESALCSAKLIAKQLKGQQVDWDKEYVDYIMKGVNVFRTYVEEWYTGNLQTLFFHRPENPEIKRQICAVLAGYVWDETNPFVKKHNRIVANLAHLINMEKEEANG